MIAAHLAEVIAVAEGEEIAARAAEALAAEAMIARVLNSRKR